MLIGEYSHNLDDKGRLSIPKKFRPDLSEGAVVTKGLDNCLFVYTKDEWKKFTEKLSALSFAQSFAQSNSRAFFRFMLAGAMDVSLDKQGRIILPDYLRKFAKLNKSVVIAGLYNRLELWDEKAWSQYKNKAEEESNEIAEKMADLGV